MNALALLRLIRPHQWVKNVFVGAPLVFAQKLNEPSYVVREAIAFAAFCAVSGAVYAFNDVRDVEADRVHPTKRRRPIASGEISERAAMIAAGVLATAALATAFVLAPMFGVITAAYLAQNIAYSVKLKHVAFVDVALIASGFLLRVLGGAVAIDVPASMWLLVCTGLLATLVGLGKRAHELAWSARSGGGVATRASLAGYRLPVVRNAMLGLAVVTTAAYVAYTLDAHTVRFFGTERLALSAPFVALGIVRFLMLALWRPRDEPPTEAMLRDPWFLADLVAATATVLVVIYA